MTNDKKDALTFFVIFTIIGLIFLSIFTSCMTLNITNTHGIAEDVGDDTPTEDITTSLTVPVI